MMHQRRRPLGCGALFGRLAPRARRAEVERKTAPEIQPQRQFYYPASLFTYAADLLCEAVGLSSIYRADTMFT